MPGPEPRGPGRGHDTMLECPEEVNRDLEAFLGECLFPS